MASTDNNAVFACPATEPETGADAETTDARIERLGRQRPEQFKTLTAEIGFCFSLLGSMALAVCRYKISRMAKILTVL